MNDHREASLVKRETYLARERRDLGLGDCR